MSDVQARGAEVVAALVGMLRALSLYDANNAAVQRSIATLADLLAAHAREVGTGMRLQVLEDECFVDGRLLKADAQLYEKSTALREILAEHGIGEVSFAAECTAADLDTWAADHARAVRDRHASVPEGGYPHIRFGTVQGRSVASFRFDPEKLAITLYVSLLDLVESTLDRAAKGEPLHLLPVKRTLQLLVDGMQEHGGIYQMLTVVRDHRTPPNVARVRTAMAMEAIGFASWMGLAAADRLDLALAAILGGMADGATTAAPRLLALSGLGESAVPVTLAVVDARSGGGGLPGRLLAVVEAFVTASCAPEASGATRILQEMRDGRGALDPALVQLFTMYKTPFPVGSVVRLSDQTDALVLGAPDVEREGGKPRVARITRNTLGERIELAQRADLTVTAVVSPARAGLDLTRLT